MTPTPHEQKADNIVFVGKAFTVKTGLTHTDGRIKILAIADNYVMARYVGCMPFVKSVKDFERYYKCKINQP